MTDLLDRSLLCSSMEGSEDKRPKCPDDLGGARSDTIMSSVSEVIQGIEWYCHAYIAESSVQVSMRLVASFPAIVCEWLVSV